MQGYNRCVRQDTAQSIVWIGQPEARFTFDHVACETVSQEVLFRVAGLPMIENCMSGYNSCVFAYGQVFLVLVLLYVLAPFLVHISHIYLLACL